MECRTLELTLRNATGLKNKTIFGKSDVYAVVSISGTHSSKLRTPVDKHATWNYPMKLTINEALGQQSRLNLVIKIKAVGLFGDRTLGQVEVPIKELMEGIKNDGKAMQETSYQVRGKSGKSRGYVSFSYKFGEKFIEPVTAYPPGFVVGSSSAYPAQPKAGYANPYQQQQPVYGQGYAGYPPPQPAPLPQRSRFGGAGLGAGLLGGALGGLLIGDMISNVGGGCGGGGCGGGCGGGGCGGGCGG